MPSRDGVVRSTFVAAMMRTSTWISWTPPRCMNLRLHEHAEDLALGLEAHGADLVEEPHVRPVSDFEETLLAGDCTGERSFDVTEEGRLQKVGGIGPGSRA